MDVSTGELARRLGDASLVILDVRRREEFSGEGGYPCDPRQGHIPGARHLEYTQLLASSPEEIRELVGLPEGTELITYCHSGQRSALAAEALRSAGYEARNYVASWHEWSRDPDLPAEHGQRGF